MRFVADSNRRKRFCRPTPSHSANEPEFSVCKDSIILNFTKAFDDKNRRSVNSSLFTDGSLELVRPAILLPIPF